MASLKTDPQNLKSAVLESEEWMKRKLKPFRPLLERMSGAWYSDVSPVDSSGDGPAGMNLGIANHEFELLSLMLPSIVFSNPRVKIDTSMPLAEDEAEALMHGTNKWIQDVDLRKEMKIVAVDFLIMWAVVLITRQPVPGSQEVRGVGGKFRRGVPNRPLATRLDPNMFFLDPMAKRFEDVAFVGHKLCESRETLLAWAAADNDGTWNVDGIKALMQNSGTETMQDQKDKGFGERDDIVYREVWVPSDVMPGFGPDQGFYGSIHTIAWDEGNVDEVKAYNIRAPRPFFGPPTGPYRLGGTYTVSNQTLPLSSPVATKGLTDALNRQKASNLRQSEAYKRIVLVDEINSDLAQKIRDTPDGNVVTVPNFSKDKAEQYEVGGITETSVAQEARLQMDLDRVSGLSDANRGAVTGKGTATEVAVADQSSDMRTSWIVEQFTSFTEDILLDVAYLLHSDDTVAFPLGMEIAQQLGMQPSMILTPSGPAMLPPDPWFHGGMSSLSFNRLSLSIEAYSMQRTSPTLQQGQLMFVTNFVTAIVPLMPTMPFINWKEFIQFCEQIMNVPELHKIVDLEIMGLMTQNMLMMQQAQMQQPMLAGDMGAQGAQPQQGGMQAPEPLRLGSGGGSSGTAGPASNRPMGNGQRADQPRKNQGTSGRSQGQFAKSGKGI